MQLNKQTRESIKNIIMCGFDQYTMQACSYHVIKSTYDLTFNFCQYVVKEIKAPLKMCNYLINILSGLKNL